MSSPVVLGIRIFGNLERKVIRKISVSCGLCLLISAAIPGAGCSSSDSPGGSAGTSSAGTAPSFAGSGTAGSIGAAGAFASAGSTVTAGSSAGGASASAGAPTSAGAPSGGTSSAGTGSGGTSSGGTSSGGAGKGGTSSAGSGNGTAGATAGTGCDKAGLVWKSANKTNYTSYPEPGSEECIKYSGCEYEGLFAECDKKQTQDWVKTHNVVAAFPLGNLGLHDLCLKSGNKTIVVTVYDTCGDNDCDGCCTQNKGNKDALIDIESFTNDRFGVNDGTIQWADLGPTTTTGCAK